MTRPVIGVSAYAERARWAAWDMPASVVPQRYLDKVLSAGGTPVVLPALPGVDGVLSRLDGLLLVGGGDIDPARYGGVPHRANGPVNAVRDAAELALLREALALRLPILGICRGLQLMNVALGGTLHQHVPDVVGHEGHTGGEGVFVRHDVHLHPRCALARALNRTTLDVPSLHHQAIDRLGRGLTACAWAGDGLIEAAELDGHPFTVGVQWHPEADAEVEIFSALVAAASVPAPVAG
ncbi:gamma-glutamyl-gamma-aminobutyrate hydrolase family protein [Actinoallomurus acaciae]|uniref:Gamma-glutamyl-gamma-aminobutyrate hydrolase family protein n=1 Tax=Actinoallomurus acaciae TaxID=502577 RepID=A0ABV5Y8Z6_9ACTN